MVPNLPVSCLSEEVLLGEKGVWESNLVGALPLLSMSGIETRCFILNKPSKVTEAGLSCCLNPSGKLVLARCTGGAQKQTYT